MTQILIGLVFAALVVFILVRRFGARKIGSELRLFVIPIVLVAVAALQSDFIDAKAPLLSESLLALGTLLAGALGAGVGYTMRIWRDAAGTPWSKGTKLSVLMLIATILVRVGIIAADYALGLAPSTGASVLFVAAWLLAQNAVIAWRVRTLPAPAVSVGL